MIRSYSRATISPPRGQPLRASETTRNDHANCRGVATLLHRERAQRCGFTDRPPRRLMKLEITQVNGYPFLWRRP